LSVVIYGVLRRCKWKYSSKRDWDCRISH